MSGGKVIGVDPFTMNIMRFHVRFDKNVRGPNYFNIIDFSELFQNVQFLLETNFYSDKLCTVQEGINMCSSQPINFTNLFASHFSYYLLPIQIKLMTVAHFRRFSRILKVLHYIIVRSCRYCSF